LAVVFDPRRNDGPFMANENPNHKFLTEDQLHQLAIVVIDMYGAGLPRDELEESIALVLENVPGYELASTRTIRRVVDQVSRYYDDTIQSRVQESRNHPEQYRKL
jgi:hypothetical protein